MDPVRVEAQNIQLAYGDTPVLRDVTLTVEPGEFFAILGPSGSGKSTLLRLIAGFNQHQAGRLLVGGKDVTGIPPWKRNVGMVFQNYALWPHLSVARNVAFGLEERRLPGAEVRRRTDAALDLVGLAGYGARRPNQLSGGQQQRVALARTLAVEPQVLLLDEPLSNLDAGLRLQMRQELLRLHRRLGITTIFVTHDQEEAMSICDRIAVMDQGVIQQIGTPVELFDEPVNRFVAQFVGSVNLLEGELLDGGMFRIDSIGSVRLPERLSQGPRRHAHLAFRPHAVQMMAGAGTSEDAAAASGGAVLPAAPWSLDPKPAEDAHPDASGLLFTGRIEAAEFLGEVVRYAVRAGSHTLTCDRLHARGGSRLAEGTPVRLRVAADEIRLIEH